MRRPVSSPNTTGGEETAIVFAIEVWLLLSSLAIQALLAWTLGPEGRGAYAVCFVFAAFFGFIFTFGVDRGAQYQVMTRRLSFSRAVSVALVVVGVGSIGVFAVGGFLIQSPLGYFRKAETSSFEIALLLIPLMILSTICHLQLHGLRRYGRSGLISVVKSSTHVVLIIAFVLVFGMGVDGALLALLCGTLVGLSLLLLDFRMNLGFGITRLGWRHFRPVLSYGARYYPAGIGHIIDLQLGTILLGLMATREEIGLFAAILALSLKVLIFSQSLETSILPRLAGAVPERQVALVGTSVRIAWLFTGTAMAGVLILSVPLVSIVLSPEFLPALPLMWILAPGIVIQGGTKILMAYFRATDRPGIVSWTTWTALTINALITVLLYPVIGLPAAAWGMTIGFASRALLLFVAYLRLSGEGPATIFLPRREDLHMIKEALARAQAKFAPISRRWKS